MLHELTIYQKCYDLILYATPIVNKYSREHRFTIGQQTLNCLLDIARLIVQANRERDKRRLQFEIDTKLEELRLLIRLAKDLHLLNLQNYGQMSERISEIGRLLGGWIKSGK